MTRSSVVENTISLLSPFIAFIPADELGCSGVLAVVTMGLYFGRRGPRVLTAETRLRAAAMWEMLTFLLEGLIFILIGLQLPQVIHALQSGVIGRLLQVSAVVVAAMIASRILWIFPGADLPRWIDRRFGRATSPYPPWRHLLFTGWAGIRGGDSLVIALALPRGAGSHAGTPDPVVAHSRRQRRGWGRAARPGRWPACGPGCPGALRHRRSGRDRLGCGVAAIDGDQAE
jgi:NhaP-type Na+/H+ or K+/H+ antiporter